MIARLEEKLQRRQQIGNLRSLQVAENAIDFASNDYLGLARSPQFSERVQQRWASQEAVLNGWGSTGSRCLTGNSRLAEEVEQQIAAFHGAEAALLFNCGYMANVGLLSTVAGEEDIFFFDARVHASMADGIRLSRAKAYPFRHSDLDHLEWRLKRTSCRGTRFIVVESIYSTDGAIAPLPQICDLGLRYGAHVIVDEAHAVGVCGPSGRGLVAEYELEKSVFAWVATFGKALGVHGAAVLGSDRLKQALVNFATPYIYTTAMPGHLLAAISCSYDLLAMLEPERNHVRRLIELCQKAGFQTSHTHIQAVPIQGNDAVKCAAKNLVQAGFDVRPLMSPTVQKGHEVLRICLHAFNTEEELTRLLNAIALGRERIDV